ncbi:MAG: zinc finger MYND domain-containing protein [Nitrosomonas sp.]|nr:zinc finger MYND domain-containing protein [Nitrosomonas sp.]
MLYKLETVQETEEACNIHLNGAKFDTLQHAFEAVDKSQVDRLWYYLADMKYIIYVQDKHAVCIDYGRFNGGDTTIIEMLDLGEKMHMNPLKDLWALEFVIKEGHRLMLCALDMQQQAKETLEARELLDSDRVRSAKMPRVVAVVEEGCCHRCRLKLNESRSVTCSRCQAAHYCDRTCQGKDLATHQVDCIKFEVKPIGQ